jgi:hypothetical protein
MKNKIKKNINKKNNNNIIIKNKNFKINILLKGKNNKKDKIIIIDGRVNVIGKNSIIIEGENDDMIIMGCNLIYGVNYKMGKI